MANQYPYPEFLQETMFNEHGVKRLITDPAADVYLDQYAEQQKKMEAAKKAIKNQYPQWNVD